MKSNFARRFWIGIGIILGSIIIAGGALYYFSGVMQKEANAIVASKAAKESEAGSLKTLALLEGQAPQAAQYEAAIKNLIPSQSGLITFSTWVAGVAGKHKVSATVAYQGTPTPPAGSTPGTAKFTMTAQGPEGSIAPFLRDLTTKEPGFIVSFSSFDFTNNQNQETIVAQGTVYFR